MGVGDNWLAEEHEVKDPVRMWSVDPGEIHCGVAKWIGAECVDTVEYGPADYFMHLEQALRTGCLDVVVIEEYRLYPSKLREQGYSKVPTVEVIGVTRYLVARLSNTVELVEQKAEIQKPTRARSRSMGIELRSTAQKTGSHCLSAELHGLYWLWYGKDRASSRKKPAPVSRTRKRAQAG